MKKAATSKKEKRAASKQSAKAMAGRRIDELADPSASKAQKRIRKRRLLNKPV
ncbi:hypothetical protein [Pseudorhodoplanes sinuspersici]|uniref:hypothetical protein n=1 Tax=Pseudorhodoplanes sinuspersici TaxID=1235591 RepID=UPI000FF5D872|nr:hypothetical protein [Pseudorhodoplanes sinuspersici]RKE65647.1 hypothetical protein DFP91_5893 [Pseudorhodoplanes sinuspersici]